MIVTEYDGCVPDRKAWGAVVLAGGESTRMGRPKAWLEMDGQPLLRRIVEIIGTVCSCIVVVGSRGQSLPPLPEATVRIDDPPDRRHQGPLVGLAAGLAELAERGFALAYLGSCDAVFLTAVHVTAMLDRLERGGEAVAPFETVGDRSFIHPLASAVRVDRALGSARALIDAGERSAISLFDRLHTARVAATELPNPRVLRTCNTPEEWQSALAQTRDG